MKKLLLLFASLLISATTLAGCSEPSTTDAPTQPDSVSTETQKETLNEKVETDETDPSPVDGDTAAS